MLIAEAILALKDERRADRHCYFQIFPLIKKNFRVSIKMFYAPVSSDEMYDKLPNTFLIQGWSLMSKKGP